MQVKKKTLKMPPLTIANLSNMEVRVDVNENDIVRRALEYYYHRCLMPMLSTGKKFKRHMTSILRILQTLKYLLMQ